MGSDLIGAQVIWTLILKGTAGLMAVPLVVIAAVFAVVLLLRHFDKSGGINWKNDVWPRLMEDSRALALYVAVRYGCTVLAIGLGVGIAVGLALS